MRQWAAAMDETVLWCCTLPADAARSLTDLLRTVRSTRSAALLDVSYHPWPTPLARDWPGRIIASGRDMLLWQAVEQVRLMTGREPPVDSMQAELDRA